MAKEFQNITLGVRHDPDYSVETGPDGLPTSVELPGFVTVGVNIDGYFHPIFTEKAGKIFEGIERAKKAQQASDQPQG